MPTIERVHVIAIGVAVALIIGLIANSIFAVDNQIILVNGNNGTPKACNGNTGLVLAQNLTDLCDVTIINPITSQIIKYNGSQWVNVNFSVMNESTVCANIGTGTAYVCKEGTNVNTRSILASTGISVSNNTSTITITNTLPEITTCVNDGHGSGNVCNSGNVHLKGIAQGTGITISQNGTDIIISNSGVISNSCSAPINCSGTNPSSISCPSCVTSGANTVGTNFQIYKNTTAGIIYFRTITNTTGISMTNTTNTITIGNTGVISNSCSAPIVCSGTNPSSISYADNPYWQMLCHTTGSGSTVSCGSFVGKKQLFIQIDFNVSSTGTAIVPAIQFNSDAGANYAWRNSFNGGADSTGTSSSSCAVIGSNTVGNNGGGIITVSSNMNFANLRKIMWINESHGIETNAGTAPTHSETGCKWSNTTNQITTITLMTSSGTATYSTGTIITVWGHD